jgi:hypothetical protein
MGIADMFGFGKKAPFRVPAEVMALRTRIAEEERENYPSLALFRELQEDAALVYDLLDSIIAEKEYADDAVRVREDIKKKMGALERKIANNMRTAEEEAGADGSRDMAGHDPAEHAQQDMRSNAGALFAEFLEAHGLLVSAGMEGGPGRGEQIHAATARIMRALSELHDKFFSAHGNDREIREMRDMAIKKIAELNSLLARALASTQDYSVRASLAADVQRLSAMAARISSI